MDPINELDNIVVSAEADKKRPFKMYAAMISAFLTSFIASGVEQPTWAVGLETAAVAALAVYLVGNPLKVTKSRTVQRRRTTAVPDDPALWD